MRNARVGAREGAPRIMLPRLSPANTTKLEAVMVSPTPAAWMLRIATYNSTGQEGRAAVEGSGAWWIEGKPSTCQAKHVRVLSGPSTHWV
jgi:hypothetical protein